MAASTSGTAGFHPDRRVPPRGVPTWPEPDPSLPKGERLPAGTLVEVLEELPDGWARVRREDGWTGWLDGRRLRPLSAAPPPEASVVASPPPEPSVAAAPPPPPRAAAPPPPPPLRRATPPPPPPPPAPMPAAATPAPAVWHATHVVSSPG